MCTACLTSLLLATVWFEWSGVPMFIYCNTAFCKNFDQNSQLSTHSLTPGAVVVGASFWMWQSCPSEPPHPRGPYWCYHSWVIQWVIPPIGHGVARDRWSASDRAPRGIRLYSSIRKWERREECNRRTRDRRRRHSRPGLLEMCWYFGIPVPRHERRHQPPRLPDQDQPIVISSDDSQD